MIVSLKCSQCLRLFYGNYYCDEKQLDSGERKSIWPKKSQMFKNANMENILKRKHVRRIFLFVNEYFFSPQEFKRRVRCSCTVSHAFLSALPRCWWPVFQPFLLNCSSKSDAFLMTTRSFYDQNTEGVLLPAASGLVDVLFASHYSADLNTSMPLALFFFSFVALYKNKSNMILLFNKSLIF